MNCCKSSTLKSTSSRSAYLALKYSSICLCIDINRLHELRKFNSDSGVLAKCGCLRQWINGTCRHACMNTIEAVRRRWDIWVQEAGKFMSLPKIIEKETWRGVYCQIWGKAKKCYNIILTSCRKDLHTIVFGAVTGVVQTLLSAFNHLLWDVSKWP